MELLGGSITELTAAVRSGRVHAREVVDAAVRRIEERDAGLNAVVAVDPGPALRRLAAAGGRPVGPLAGLPYLVKDLHAEVAGFPLARGSRLAVGLAPAGTSTLLRRLEQAGALIIGRTNSPEFGLNITTEPVLHGPTRNPWRPDRSAGGSSGGAAVAVAAGMVPAGPGRALRVGLLTEAPDGTPVHPGYRAAAESVAAELAAAGHRVVPVGPVEPAGRLGPVLGAVIAGHLTAAVDDICAATGRAAGPETLEPAVLDLVRRGRRADARTQVRATMALRGLAGELAAVLDGVDLLLSPTTARPAPPLGQLHTDRPAGELFREIFAISPFVGMFNVTGGPAISLPWGCDDAGMPIGVQLGARPGDDVTVLAVAAALEAARPDLVRPGPTAAAPGHGAPA
ncbi:amidase [Micromonospora sp. Llam0]|uniref:amidase n=1 Tax=Micromonospora sp. Llam0 TaxID=2485143 RepID=UPI000F90B461|nr:amidase [Micromonospora sp. Llam0]ROO60163.1 amidase [Micromonospora sp. Llam0]